ncbi:hypothetical protein BJ508DRAFT_64318 [Ascobolus immersus RN42]|uniref:Uncharacterized protein n=1 Tax=Ascobolus immersus RN42 TaxID=1160509 RepID=A0A3N4IPX8_ASCIM|nr:hypothetical protein BJ508DRAFT_64318 [Ascobolus immersus RN42]
MYTSTMSSQVSRKTAAYGVLLEAFLIWPTCINAYRKRIKILTQPRQPRSKTEIQNYDGNKILTFLQWLSFFESKSGQVPTPWSKPWILAERLLMCRTGLHPKEQGTYYIPMPRSQLTVPAAPLRTRCTHLLGSIA